jgi:hypothetical protein
MSFRKIIYFIQYNNLTVLIVVAVFLAGAGVFAQTPTGQDLIGVQQAEVKGVDNTLLLEADLEKFTMDFKIEKIEEDAKYYYVTYTYLDLVPDNNAWQYEIQEKVRKISKKLKQDLGAYMAKQLQNEYEQRIRDLKAEKVKAKEEGNKTRTEVVAYTGLIGQTLDVVGKVFPSYEPVKQYEIPSPTVPPSVLQLNNIQGIDQNPADNLEQVYQDYLNSHNLDNLNPPVDTASSTDATTTAPGENVETPAPTTDAAANTDAAAANGADTTIDNSGTEVNNADNVQVIELPAETAQ